MKISLLLLVFFIAGNVYAQTPPQGISATFHSKDRDRFLAASDFTISKTVAKIPASVSKELAKMYKLPSLEMADPGQTYQSTDVIVQENLPIRRLAFVATSREFCAIHYEVGGIASRRIVLIFQTAPDSAHLIWGGILFKALTDVPSLKAFINSNELIMDSLENNW